MNNYHEHQDFQYFNISISNTDNIQFRAQAETFKYNDRPLVRDTTNKVLSIERVNIPTSSIPIFISRPLDENDFIDPRLDMKLSLSFSNITVEKNLAYITSSDIGTVSYWWVFTYSIFVKMVNTTFQEIFSELSGLIGLPMGSSPPYIEFDEESQLFSLVAQKAFYDTSLPIRIKIGANAFFQQKLDALVGKFFNLGFTNPANIIYEYDISDLKNNSDTIIGLGDVFRMTQNYNILSKWNSLKAIRIVSNLPVANEFVDGTYKQNSTDAGKTLSQNIIKDFTINYNEFSSTGRTEVVYSQGERIYLHLLPNHQIQNIFLKIFWIDETGNSIPLVLAPYETALIKFLVKNKDMMF